MTEWNDDRLDELNGRMKEGFAEVDKRFDKVDKRFEQVATKEEMVEVRTQLNRLNDRFDRFLFILLGACVGLIGSFLIAVFGLVLQS